LTTDPPIRRIDVRSLVIWAVIVLSVAGVMSRSRSSDGELSVYNDGTHRMMDGEEVYRSEQGAFTYPPFWAMLFAPVAVLAEHESLQKFVWCALNLTLLIWIGHRLIARLSTVLKRRDDDPPYWVYGLGLAILTGRFVVSPLEYQAHDLVIFALVWAGIEGWCSGREERAGGWIGAAAACKATPLLFGPLFVWHRRWKAAAACGVVCLATTLAPDVVFPRPDGRLWSVAWVDSFVSKVQLGAPANAGETWKSWNKLNQSLGGTLYRLSTPVPTEGRTIDVHLWHLDKPGLRLVTLSLQAGVLLFIGFVTWPRHSRHLSDPEQAVYRLGEASVILCGMLLLSPMSSKYHFVTLVVPIAFCLGDFLFRKRDRVVGAKLILLLLLGPLTAKGLIGKSAGDTVLAYGAVTASTILVLLCTGHILYHRARSMPAANDKQATPSPDPAS
jgi:hypothetical protein